MSFNTATYRNVMEDYPLLTAEQEKKLLKAAASSDKEVSSSAKDILLKSNYRLIIKIVGHYKGVVDLDAEDLFQAGAMGCLRAIDKFDMSKNTRFSTYATQHIRAAISREIENNSDQIRIPVYFRSFIRKVKKVEEDLKKEDQEVTAQDIADELGESVEKVEKALSIAKPISYDSPLKDTDKSILDTYESSDNPLDDMVNDNERAQLSMEAYNSLTEQEKEFVRLKWNYGEEKNLPIRDNSLVAKKMKLTEEEVEEIEDSIYEKFNKAAKTLI